MKIFSAGDVVNSSGRQDIVSAELRSLITSCDLSLCNFEAPVVAVADPVVKVGPSLQQRYASAVACASSGFNVVSLANNHIYDYGDKGVKSTLAATAAAGLLSVGAGCDYSEAYTPVTFEHDGQVVAVFSACEAEFGAFTEDEGRCGYAWLNSSALDEAIVAIRDRVDNIILLAHAGIEDVDLPLPEWRSRYRYLCRLGVKLIFAHHPHVPQGYELYRDSLICYSLGNFYFDSGCYGESGNESYSLLIDLDISGGFTLTPVFHKVLKGVTSIVTKNEVSFSLEVLNNKLSDNYLDNVTSMSVELYRELYYGYYQRAMSGVDLRSPVQSAIRLFRLLVLPRAKRKKKDALLLYHNIYIESHRYVVQRAIKYLYLGGRV